METLRLRAALCLGFGGAIFALAAGGCSQQPATPSNGGEEALYRLYEAYTNAEQTLQRPPRSAAEIAPHVPQRAGSLDHCLVSPNDEQEFVVFWGVKTLPRGPLLQQRWPKPSAAYAAADPTAPLFPILAYERTGNAGRRYCLFVTGVVHPLNEAAFAAATLAAGGPAPKH